MIKISKFGGSSLANAQQFKKVKKIIESDPSRRFVVVSASGKEHPQDNKITDLLYLIEAHLTYHVDPSSLFELIKTRFLNINKTLHLKVPIEEILKQIQKDFKEFSSIDYLVSRGEYITAKLMAAYLGFPFLDAKDVVRFHYDGSLDKSKTTAQLQHFLKDHDSFVMPGFYGALPDGTIKIMSRGGSDVSGSILADILDADMYENWTDVSGILMADPHIVDAPKRIDTISYSELRELSYMGANVLHEEAIFPVKEKNIPIKIMNTNHPEEGGTIIIEKNTSPYDQDISGIAGKKDFTVIAIYKNHMSDEVGIIKRALEVFEHFQISIEHIPSGIDSFSIVVHHEDIKHVLFDVIAKIKAATQADRITINEHIALITCVGRNMIDRPGISGKLFAVLGKHAINIRMIAQGTDEMNIIVGVENDDYEKTIRTIYDDFVL